MFNRHFHCLHSKMKGMKRFQRVDSRSIFWVKSGKFGGINLPLPIPLTWNPEKDPFHCIPLFSLRFSRIYVWEKGWGCCVIIRQSKGKRGRGEGYLRYFTLTGGANAGASVLRGDSYWNKMGFPNVEHTCLVFHFLEKQFLTKWVYLG